MPASIRAAASADEFGIPLCETETVAQAYVGVGAAGAFSSFQETGCGGRGRAAGEVAGRQVGHDGISEDY